MINRRRLIRYPLAHRQLNVVHDAGGSARGMASLFNAATCLSATDCVAVGQLGPVHTIDGVGLSGFWNGRGWQLVTAK